MLAGAGLYLGALAFTPPLPLDLVLSFPSSPLVLDKDGNPLWVGLNERDQVSVPLSLDKMGKTLPMVLIQVEDRRFLDHRGVDWLGIARAFWQNLKQGKIVSGGSTITSQIIRMVQPRERTFKTKALEFLQALDLERRLTKDEILESYLNLAPFGGNLRGAGAGALGWFGKSPKDLSLAEASTLVAMLKGPGRYRPDLHPKRALDRRNAVIDLLVKRKIISKSDGEMAKLEALPEGINLPRTEFLYVRNFLKSHPKGGVSDLDRALQAKVRGAVSRGLLSMPKEITACALVMENPSGAIRAYIGNGRFGEPLPWAWIDCCLSKRSPGSALKPFVYAGALDDGLLSPSSLMADTPLAMSGRAPRNFDLLYRGAVSMSQALVQSLNVPAVRALRALGVERFLYKLRSLGFSGLLGDGFFYGDSLILGGCEVTPLEMAEAYRTFVSGKGRHVSPFSRESAYLIGLILRDKSRLSREKNLLIPTHTDFAFKTGTSYGLRDAWAVGWNRDWTVVVWAGDPTGASHKELVGLSASVPIMVRVLKDLGGDMGEAPPGVAKREVCALSGLPPNSSCPRVKEAWYIPGVSPSEPCRIHSWKEGKRIAVLPPQLSEKGEKTLTIMPFKITSPVEGLTYIMSDFAQRIPLLAEGSFGQVWWFLDGVFLGKSKGDEALFWELTKGRHKIGAMDESGRSHYVKIEVLGP